MRSKTKAQQGVSVYQGRYHRTIGKVRLDQGKFAKKKFLLGTDRVAAEYANGLLEQLWEAVISEHADALRFTRTMGGRLGDLNLISGVRDYDSRRRVDTNPVWREESLAIAEAVRKGIRQIEVQLGDDHDRPDAYVERIDSLQKTYPVIAFVPASLQSFTAGQQSLAAEAQEIAEATAVQVQAMAKLANSPIPVANGQTLYKAIDAYAVFAVQKNRKEFGEKEAESARRLKASHPDIPLSQFGISAMEKIAAYWAGRPPSKKTGQPIALSTVTNHLKTTRRFIRWVHRSDTFTWSRPIDAEDALRVRVAGLRNPKEISAMREGVAVWTIEELTTLFSYGTDRERLLLLLGLNCGFTQAEISGLRLDEIMPEESGISIRRIRHKSQVYGEFILWPESVAAIEWFRKWLRGAPRTADIGEHLMITGRGSQYDRISIANAWSDLLDRVGVDRPAFRRLSFKALRKTAGQLIRERSDGEISGCSCAMEKRSRRTCWRTYTLTGRSGRLPAHSDRCIDFSNRCSTRRRTPSLRSPAVLRTSPVRSSKKSRSSIARA